jgi:hypothetical protein
MMADWTPADWTTFLTALGGFVTVLGGVIATIVLQVRGNRKTAESAMVSQDNNDKLSAVVAQTHEIARAVPQASTAPTEDLVNADPAIAARKAGA